MFRRVLSVFTNQIFVYVLQMVAGILSARLLGPEQRGAAVVALLIATLVSSLAHLGMPGALIYNLSRSDKNQNALAEAIGVSIGLTPVMIAVILVSYLLAYQYGHNSLLRGLPSALVLSSFILCLISLLNTLVVNMLTGLQDYRWRNFLSLWTPLMIAIILFCFWASHLTLTVSVFIWARILAMTLGVLLGTTHMIRVYRPALRLQLPAGWRQDYVGYGMKSYIAMIAQNLNYRLDTLLLNALMGNKAVGLYSAGVATAELLLFTPNAVSLVLYPTIASVRKQERDRIALLSLGSSLYLVLGTGILMSLLTRWLIPLFYGQAFASAIPAAQWLLPGMLALTIVKTLSVVVSGLGRPEYMTYGILVGLLGTTVLDFLLIPHFGIIGAAWASSLAYWLAAATLFILYVRLSKASPTAFVRGLLIEPVVWSRRRWNKRLANVRTIAG